jgi:hypothetical protein
MVRFDPVQLVMACLLTMLWGAGPALATADETERCVYPDPYALMDNPYASPETALYIYSNNPQVRWLFISWGAPPGGELFVLACNGHILAKRNFYKVERLDFGPNILNRTSIETWYIPASGTGINNHSVAILLFDGNSIRIVWDHDLNDVSSAPADLFTGEPQGKGMRTDEQTFQWQFASDERVIEVTGHETRATESRTIRHVLPPEKYCFSASILRYVRCK